MQPVQFFAFFLGLCGNLAYATPTNSDDPISTNLKLVAAADGKSFFADKTTLRTWTETKRYCEDMGMTFAAITSEAQADALRTAYSSDFDGVFWTSGRDAHERRQFTWDSFGGAISEDYPEMWVESNFPYHTCLIYHSHNRYLKPSTLNYDNCGSKRGALCSV